MKKCVSAILILLVLCMLVGCSNNNSIIPTEYNEPTVTKTERFTEKPTERPTEAPTQVQPIIESSYTIYEAVTPFASDRAWVTYRDSDNQLDPNGNKTDRDELDNKYGDYAIGDINVKNGFEKVYDSTAKKYDSYSSATGSSISTVYRLSNYSAIASQEMSEMSKAPTEHNDN